MSELPVENGWRGPGVVVEVDTAEGRTYVEVRSIDAASIGGPFEDVARSFRVPETEIVLPDEWLFEIKALGPDEAFMFGTLGYLLGWDRFDGGWLTAEAKGYSFYSKSRGWIEDRPLGRGTDVGPSDGRLGF
ncbi:MAG: hypothetical protein R2770_08825 [Acidimicrobiales bacterium]